MRVCTRNIGWWFVSGKDKDKYDKENLRYFIDEIDKVSPDIVCLQEVNANSFIDQAMIIWDALWYEWVYTQRISDSHLKEDMDLSISILHNFAVIETKFYLLSNPGLKMIWNGKEVMWHDKGFLEVIVECGKFKFRIISWHMPPAHRFWKDYFDSIFDDIRKQAQDIILWSNLPTIIGIDLNYDSSELLFPRVFEAWFFSLVDESKPTIPLGRSYDKILCSSDWEMIWWSTIIWKADHYLCYADIKEQ